MAVLWPGLLAVGCVYPRRSTSLSPAHASREGLNAPAYVVAFTIVSAQTPARARGDLAWDDGGGLPDCYVRVYRNETQVFESSTLFDTLEPRWNETLPRNLYIPPDADLRFEVWDRDTVGGDPVGVYRNRGLPDHAVPGALALIPLDSGATLTVRVDAPRAHRGVGIEEYELQPAALVIRTVAPYSPAARAGLARGDRIVAIGERPIDDLSDAEAASALSLAQDRRHALRVTREDGAEREVELDEGHVWLSL